MIKFFSYGTLQKPSIQMEVFGRELTGKVDALSNYKVLNDLEIEGEKYPRLVAEKNGIVFGMIYELTREEMKILDEYETEAYTRTNLVTDNGIVVDIYWSDGRK